MKNMQKKKNPTPSNIIIELLKTSDKQKIPIPFKVKTHYIHRNKNTNDSRLLIKKKKNPETIRATSLNH